jgi:hypothetical protein
VHWVRRNHECLGWGWRLLKKKDLLMTFNCTMS